MADHRPHQETLGFYQSELLEEQMPILKGTLCDDTVIIGLCVRFCLRGRQHRLSSRTQPAPSLHQFSSHRVRIETPLESNMRQNALLVTLLLACRQLGTIPRTDDPTWRRSCRKTGCRKVRLATE
jgi:hypothetical protein